MIVFIGGKRNRRNCFSKAYILPEACTESIVGFGVIFKLIDVTEIRMIERCLETLLSICLYGAYVYCMFRQGESLVVLVTGSAQIKVFIYRTVCIGALVTH